MEPSVGCPGVRHNISVNADARERALVQRHTNQCRCARRGASPLAGACYLSSCVASGIAICIARPIPGRSGATKAREAEFVCRLPTETVHEALLKLATLIFSRAAVGPARRAASRRPG